MTYQGNFKLFNFSGNDPSTDLRAVGLLGLMNLIYLLRDPKRQALAHDIYKLSLHPTQVMCTWYIKNGEIFALGVTFTFFAISILCENFPYVKIKPIWLYYGNSETKSRVMAHRKFGSGDKQKHTWSSTRCMCIKVTLCWLPAMIFRLYVVYYRGKQHIYTEFMHMHTFLYTFVKSIDVLGKGGGLLPA